MIGDQDHDQLIRIGERLGRMELRLDEVLSDHEHRLRRLERQSWLGWGSLSAAIAMLVAVVRLIVMKG